jgi:phosphoglycolate phosphatase
MLPKRVPQGFDTIQNSAWWDQNMISFERATSNRAIVPIAKNSSVNALLPRHLDGTLADSFPWFLRTINDVADRFGFRRVTDEDVDRLRRSSTREILNHLEVPLWKLPAIARHMRKLKGDAAAQISLFAGVEPMLRTLAARGVQLALVTSDSEANARAKLGDLAALFSQFDCAASLYGKPGRFRRVIARTGVAPSSVIAIGDEVRDIEAARAAGIACGAVCWGYAAPTALRARRPDVVFERIDEIAHALCPAP